MEEKSLSALLEEDKELLLESVSRDRTPQAAQAAVEKELDRILYRCSENALTEEQSLGVQTVLKTARNALPLLGAVSEVREWQRSLAEGEKKRKIRPLGPVLALAGLLLVFGAVLVLMKKTEGALTFAALLPPLLGAACLLWGGGLLFGKKGGGAKPEEEKRQEFLVDAAGIYRTLRGALLAADRDLGEMQELRARNDARNDPREGGLSGEETELFATLLEAAYARRGSGEDAEELIGSIRYYLHRRGVETIEYEKGNERWFELLPARRSGTMRPALLCEGRLLKKGLASAAEG